MSIVRLHGFSGIAPKLDPVFLKSHQSQVAKNCRLDGGALRSWRSNRDEADLALAGEIKTIYQMPGGEWLQFTQDVDIVKSQLADDATDRHYYTGTDVPRVTNNALVDEGGDNIYPENSYILGVPAPTGAPTATLVSGAPVTPVDTAYVYTFVNDWGEESAPSPVSNIVACDFDVESINLTTLDAAPAGDYVPINKWNVSSPQYNDSILTEALGESLVTEDWDFPPAGLIGLTEMANGIFAGFVDNKVYFSEPYIPYAYPDKYSFTVPVDVVGLGSFGSTLVVTTKSNPYTITGITPESMSMAKLPVRQACVSKRSIVNLNRGVAYACPDGVFYVGDNGTELVTKDHYTREEWQALTPTASHAERVDENYVIFFTALKQGLLIDPESGPVFLDIDADAVWSDDEGDKLYMAIYDETALTTSIKEFNAGGSRLNYTWRSKSFLMPQLIAMTSCKLNADYDAEITQEETDEIQAERDALTILNAALIASGDLCSSINGNVINEYPINGDCLWLLPIVPTVSSYVLKIFGDGELLVEQVVSSVSPFRVPIVERYNQYEIEISGQYPVRDVVLATSIRELKAYAAS